MALSPEVQQTIAEAKQLGFDKLNQFPPAQTREQMKHIPPLPNPTTVGEVINYTTPDGDLPVRIYRPTGAGPFPVIMYFHGGGFVLMSLDTHDEICRQLCAKTGSVVVSVDYPLAPEHPYPAGPEGSLRATHWMRQHAADYQGIPEQMAVAGDSAGGYLALYVAQKLMAEGIHLRAQVAVYPVTDHYSAQHASWEENKEGYVLTAETMKWFWDNYLPDLTNIEEASILRAPNFAGLPPALIMTANYDPLRDEGKAYASQLEQAGVETIYQNYENVHGFFGAGAMGQEAMQLAADFLKAHLKA